MPFYDYTCKACGHKFEKLVSMSERKSPELSECPKCAEFEVKLDISTPAVFTDSAKL